MTHWGTLTSHSSLDSMTGIRIYQVSGALTGSHDAYALLERVRSELRIAPHHALFDLAAVDHLTSAGVGIIAAIYTSADETRHKVALCSLSRHNALFLNVVHLDRVIPVFGSRTDALDAFVRDGWSLVETPR